MFSSITFGYFLQLDLTYLGPLIIVHIVSLGDAHVPPSQTTILDGCRQGSEDDGPGGSGRRFITARIRVRNPTMPMRCTYCLIYGDVDFWDNLFYKLNCCANNFTIMIMCYFVIFRTCSTSTKRKVQYFFLNPILQKYCLVFLFCHCKLNHTVRMVQVGPCGGMIYISTELLNSEKVSAAALPVYNWPLSN